MTLSGGDTGGTDPVIPASPVPTDAADSVLSLFSDAYTDQEGTNFNPDWGQGTQVAVSDVITYTALDYQGTDIASSDVSGYAYIRLDVYTTDATDLQFTIISPGAENLLSLSDQLVLDQWVTVEIALTDFVANLAAVNQLKVVGNGTVLLDNIYFGGVAPAPEPVVATTYCSAPVTHFNIADHPGSILLTVENSGADSMTVTASSNEGQLVDVLIVEAIQGGGTATAATIVDGVATSEITWAAGTMPATTSFAMLWSDDAQPGNQMVNAGDGTDGLGNIDTSNVCAGGDTGGTDPEPDTTVSFTATLPAGTASARLHSDALGWDLNHADGVASDNGDGTWTATIPAPWGANANYKWVADGVEENLKDDVDAGYCANDGLNSGDWGANRVYSGSGDVTGAVFGECSDTPADGGADTGPVNSDVTFSVDMTGVDLTDGNPTLQSTFNSWCGGCNPMSDDDGDNIWTVTVNIPQGDHEYKYALGAWVSQEAVPADCDNTLGANRAVTVTGDVTLATDVYSGCPGDDTSGGDTGGTDPEPPVSATIALPVDFEEAADAYEIAGFDGGVATVEAGPDGAVSLKYVKGAGQNWLVYGLTWR